MRTIPYNKPYMTGKELWYIAQAHTKGHLAGDGSFTKKCQEWLKVQSGSELALLTHSCTAALEIAAILADTQPGDEIIMPSYTFVSTANAFVLRGGIPVFVDIRRDTLNLDENKIEEAITEKTKVIVPVHYAGVSCEMDTIIEIAEQYNLKVIEDAAQALLSTYKGKAVGTMGELGALSFHETKNLISGEGGALLINEKELIERAEIIREKGTDRSRFFRGEKDKYCWQDIGSSYLPSDIIAAFLWAQMEEAEEITKRRMQSWCYYIDLLSDIASRGTIRLPIVPSTCKHNAHMFYILLRSGEERDRVHHQLQEKGIGAIFHYIPLHSSPAGKRYGRSSGDLRNTNNCAASLLRLPLWCDIPAGVQEYIVETLTSALF